MKVTSIAKAKLALLGLLGLGFATFAVPARAADVTMFWQCAVTSASGVTTYGQCPVTNANPLPVNASVTATPPANVTPTDCSGTITLGGTAQAAFAGASTIHGFVIANIDASAGSGEPLWMSMTGTATAATAASYPLSAPTATTFAGLASFTTPYGLGINHAVSVVAATTGHKFSCTYW